MDHKHISSDTSWMYTWKKGKRVFAQPYDISYSLLETKRSHPWRAAFGNAHLATSIFITAAATATTASITGSTSIAFYVPWFGFGMQILAGINRCGIPAFYTYDATNVEFARYAASRIGKNNHYGTARAALAGVVNGLKRNPLTYTISNMRKASLYSLFMGGAACSFTLSTFVKLITNKDCYESFYDPFKKLHTIASLGTYFLASKRRTQYRKASLDVKNIAHYAIENANIHAQDRKIKVKCYQP